VVGWIQNSEGEESVVARVCGLQSIHGVARCARKEPLYTDRVSVSPQVYSHSEKEGKGKKSTAAHDRL